MTVRESYSHALEQGPLLSPGWRLGDQICPILLSERGNLPFYIFPLLSVLSTAMDSDEKAANLFFQQ